MLESTVKEEPRKAGIFTRSLEFAAALLLVLITLVVTLQIVCRYILLELPPWSEELSRYLFIWANFVGAGVALARSSHVSIDSLVTRMSGPVRRKLETVVVVLVTTFAIFLLYQGIVTASAMKDNYSITMHFSMAWVFAALPAAGFIFLLYQFQKIFKRKDLAATCVSAIGVVVLTAALAFIGEHTIRIGDHSRKALRYAFKPDIGPIRKFFGQALGKLPADFHYDCYILGDEVPAFVQFDGPLQLMGPTRRIELISPRVHVSTGNEKHASR